MEPDVASIYFKPNGQPFLWILTSSLALDVLAKLGAVEDAEGWEKGVYFLPKVSHTGFAQASANDDVIALPKDNFH